MEGIFISYRRDDSAGYAGRLYDRLAAHFGADTVFMDVEGIEPGTDFVKAIESAVASCKVLIVLIGDQWLTATDTTGRRRLDDPHDFIRLETSTALQRDIRVVPVLVDKAVMPPMEELPEDLRSLVRRQAVELNHKQWEATSGELIKTLEKILEMPAEQASGGTKPKEDGGKSPAAGPGGMLWIAVAAMAVIAAGIAFWRFSPVDDIPPSLPATPLTNSSEPSKPNTKLPEAPPVPSEIIVETAPKPEPDEPASEKKKQITTVEEVVVESSGPVATPLVPALQSKDSDPVLVTEKIAEVVEPVTAQPTPTIAAMPEPIPVKPVPPKPEPIPVKPVPAKPEPIPVKPVPSKPEPSPTIISMTTKAGETAVAVCYRVEHARRLRLMPTPGALKNNDKGCVDVTLDKPTRFTLNATGPGGSSSRQITVEPHPDRVAELKQLSKLPAKGERWVYQTRGKWPTSPRLKFQISIDHADKSLVSETMSILEPTAKAAGKRNANGAIPGFISWPDIGLEFSPWISAYVELSGNKSWEGFAAPAIGSWDRWNSNASTTEREQVKVPAGSFDAWKVEVWSSRNATGGPTLAGQEPVRMQFLVWYAPQVKRYVKSVRKILSANGQIQEEDLFELTEYRPN